MSKLTPSQHATLVWLEKIGGVCVAWRDKVASPIKHCALSEAKAKGSTAFVGSPDEYRLMPAVSALHLVQRGCIEERNGRLHITEYGRRVLK